MYSFALYEPLYEMTEGASEWHLQNIRQHIFYGLIKVDNREKSGTLRGASHVKCFPPKPLKSTNQVPSFQPSENSLLT